MEEQFDSLGDTSNSSTTSSSGYGGSRKEKRDKITVSGKYGSSVYRRDDDPDVGDGDIEYVAVFDGAVDYKDDAILGPVSVGDDEAEQFRDEIEDRVEDIEFKDWYVEDDD